MQDPIRKLARSVYWQNCYSNAKSLGFISLFNNNKNLTKIQILFLHWLNIYNSLFQDLANEEDYLSEAVIEDEIRADAYLYWRRKAKDKPAKKKEDTSEEASNILGIPKIVFKNKKSKRKK